MVLSISIFDFFAIADTKSVLPECVYINLDSNGNRISATLEDDDSDGIYTGYVRLPKSFDQFAVCVNTGKGQNSATEWGMKRGDYTKTPFIYSDCPYEVNLISISDYEDELDCITVEMRGEESSELFMSVNWNEYINGVLSPRLSIECKTEPPYGYNPDCMYLIGDFNNFRLPDANGSNGAIQMNKSEGTGLKIFNCELDISDTSTVDMLVYCPKIAFSENVFYGFIQSFPFTLYKYAVEEDAVFYNDHVALSDGTTNIPEDGHIKLHDLTGNTLNIRINLEIDGYIKISDSEARFLEIKPDSRVQFKNVIKGDNGVLTGSCLFYENCEAWLSDGAGDSFDSSTSWGAPHDIPIDLGNRPVLYSDLWMIPCVKNGFPYKFISGKNEFMNMNISINPYNGYAVINGYESSGIEQASENISELTYRDGKVTIKYADGITLYSLDGRRLFSCEGDTADLTCLPSGVYIVKSTGRTEKIVKR